VGLVERRIGLLFAIFSALLVLGGARALWLGGVRGGDLARAAATQQVVKAPILAKRGTITDRHGTELAVSEEALSIAATPYLVKDPGAAARRLAPWIGVPEAELIKKLSDRRSGFVYLQRKVPRRRAEQVRRMDIAGLEFLPESRRIYPRSWLAAQLLGTVGTDGDGLAGLEYEREQALHGSDGERTLVRDALGRPLRLRDTKLARAGQSLELTIDARIQDRVEDVLKRRIGQRFQPQGATAIVMDPRNGEVLALANWPRVNANKPWDAPEYARKDRAVSDLYEPGSTFKAFTVAGALQDGIVTPGTEFDLPPQIQVADRTIKESHLRGPVRLSTAEILAQSSNVGAVTIGKRLGEVRFDHWVRAFGFAKPTGVDLPGEAAGIVPKPENYSGSSIGNIPIGQGVSVTPMQMATAYAAIANGGTLRPPRVVRAVGGVPERRAAGRRVISAATAKSVRQMLEGVLAAGGTAREAAIPGYVLAGKTGTAEKPDPVNGGYAKGKYIASFVGFAPAKNPRLLVAVMVDEPKGEIYGGTVAAPAFQEIMRFALPYLRIPPTEDPDAPKQGLPPVAPAAQAGAQAEPLPQDDATATPNAAAAGAATP
jgi:cell division protein FtsI (penicillin-binding protein 3)